MLVAAVAAPTFLLLLFPLFLFPQSSLSLFPVSLFPFPSSRCTSLTVGGD